jgi:hypothetical protein
MPKHSLKKKTITIIKYTQSISIQSPSPLERAGVR